MDALDERPELLDAFTFFRVLEISAGLWRKSLRVYSCAAIANFFICSSR
jgi:hypothetical protein